MNRLILVAMAAVAPLIAHADITPKQAETFLLQAPPKVLNTQVPKHYQTVERLTKAMFSNTAAERHGEGYRNYLIVKNYADLRNPYAAYNAGLYQVINRDKFGFKYTESLLYLKLAADGGVPDAKFALAQIYLNNTDEIAKLINGLSRLKGVDRNSAVVEDKQKFKALGQQYVLELAQQGHEKAYMTACNFYASGQYLQQDTIKAAVCYNNAIKSFDSSVAKSLLAKLYFEAPQFTDIEYERKGIEISKEAAAKGNMYAIVNLAKQLMKPNHAENLHLDIGLRMLQNAAAHGDEKAIDYLAQHLGEDGVMKAQKDK